MSIDPSLNIAAFELDFASRSNCSVVRRVQPGHEVCVLVRRTDDPRAAAILGKGRRSADGTSFDVRVETGAAIQRFDWNYSDLLLTIDRFHPAMAVDLQGALPGTTDRSQLLLRHQASAPDDFAGDAMVENGSGA